MRRLRAPVDREDDPDRPLVAPEALAVAEGDEMIGRRVATIDEIKRPGDYCGPIEEVDGEGRHVGRAVWFLLPIADPADPFRRELHDRAGWIATRANGLHRVAEPPWTFRECPDGSLEIRASILCGAHEADCEPYWHGYLDEGHVWRSC